MTLKQRERAVKRAVTAMDKAADALGDLQSMCIKAGIDMAQDERFASDLRERAAYWNNCTWYKKSEN